MVETRTSRLSGYASLPLRVALAAVFMYTGWKKLIDLDAAIASFTSIGIILPSLFAPLVAIAEFFGGLGILVGVLPRFSAAVLSIVMIQAWWTVYSLGRPFVPNLAFNIALLGGLLTIVIGGIGRGNVSQLLHRPGLDIESLFARRFIRH